MDDAQNLPHLSVCSIHPHYHYYPLTALPCTSFVNVSVSPSDWLTVRAGSQAQCQGAAAVNVNFTQDLQTACFLPLRGSESCQQLQERALEALTPWSMSVSHVGRVGDPDPLMISEWVPIVNNGVEGSTVVSVHMYYVSHTQCAVMSLQHYDHAPWHHWCHGVMMQWCYECIVCVTMLSSSCTYVCHHIIRFQTNYQVRTLHVTRACYPLLPACHDNVLPLHKYCGGQEVADSSPD